MKIAGSLCARIRRKAAHHDGFGRGRASAIGVQYFGGRLGHSKPDTAARGVLTARRVRTTQKIGQAPRGPARRNSDIVKLSEEEPQLATIPKTGRTLVKCPPQSQRRGRGGGGDQARQCRPPNIQIRSRTGILPIDGLDRFASMARASSSRSQNISPCSQSSCAQAAAGRLISIGLDPHIYGTHRDNVTAQQLAPETSRRSTGMPAKSLSLREFTKFWSGRRGLLEWATRIEPAPLMEVIQASAFAFRF